MYMSLPNFLTCLRILLIPLFLAVFYLWESPACRDVIATAIFLAAAITDWLDGWLARRWGQTSAFGEFLDPVADKLMICAALIVLLEYQRVDAWIALVIIGREITISALREWMARLGAHTNVAVHWLGKLKTAAQMIAIPALLFNAEPFAHYLPFSATHFTDNLHQAGEVLLIIAAILTVWSMLYYIKRAWPSLKS